MECKDCPHTVGDITERDCAFPDCQGGWETAYRKLTADLTAMTKAYQGRGELLTLLEAELAEAKQQLDDIRNLGSIPAEEVAKYYLDHERNDGFSQARLTSVIKRARMDGANEFRNEVGRLLDAIDKAHSALVGEHGGGATLVILNEALTGGNGDVANATTQQSRSSELAVQNKKWGTMPEKANGDTND